MATKAAPVALYEKRVATLPGVARTGDTVPYTSAAKPARAARAK